MDIDLVSVPRLYRDENFRKRTGGIVKNGEFVKVAMAGAAVVAVVSCMVLLTWQHQQKQNWNDALSESSSAWKQKFEMLENRVKRNAESLAQYDESSHNIKKRYAEQEVTPIPEDHESPPVGGAVYVRWGRHDCPEIGPSRLIYHGVTAGSWYTHLGGGANFICLHGNVSYESGHYVDGNQGASYIYGAEWRDSSWINSLLDLRDTMSGTIQYHSIPCALCMAERRNGKVMIPGRRDCPEHWIHEYDGYIMSNGHSDKHSTEYICVDRRPQVVPGTQGAQNGAYMYMVETQCTSLHCEPVVAGREISCVVCTI